MNGHNLGVLPDDMGHGQPRNLGRCVEESDPRGRCDRKANALAWGITGWMAVCEQCARFYNRNMMAQDATVAQLREAAEFTGEVDAGRA